MEITIQRELREICPHRKSLSDDLLEVWLDYAAKYSKECWLILKDEHLRRLELEIAII
jgi:hypothetical protein